MKKSCLFFALATVVVALTSCLNSEYHSTPTFAVGPLTRYAAAGVHDTINYGDTIQIGDTLFAPFALYGVYNNLTEFTVQADQTVFDILLVNDSSMLHLLAKESAPEKGYLRFVTGCTLFETTFRYIAKKEGDYKLSFVLASDAGEKYSPLEFWFNQPVR